MRFTLETKTAKQLITLMSKVADTQSRMPILGAVCMTVQPGPRIELRATDLDTDMRITLKAKHAQPEEGMALTSCNNLLKLLRKTKTSRVTFATRVDSEVNTKLLLQAGKAEFALDTFMSGDYPNWIDDHLTASADVNYYGLRRIIMQTEYSASFDDGRPNLSGMLFEMNEEDEELLVVTTDGHRLTMASTDIEGYAEHLARSGKVLASRYAVKRLIAAFKAFPDCEQCVVSFSDKYLLVNMTLGEDSEIEHVVVKLKLNDAKFPPFSKVIMKGEPKYTLIVQRSALQEAVDTLSIVHELLRIVGASDSLTLSAESDEMTGTQSVEGYRIKTRNGQAAIEELPPVGVMNKYMMETLKAWPDESEILVSLYEPSEQIQLRGRTTQPFAILMPIML